MSGHLMRNTWKNDPIKITKLYKPKYYAIGTVSVYFCISASNNYKNCLKNNSLKMLFFNFARIIIRNNYAFSPLGSSAGKPPVFQ